MGALEITVTIESDLILCELIIICFMDFFIR